jgi:hypothetical protein
MGNRKWAFLLRRNKRVDAGFNSEWPPLMEMSYRYLFGKDYELAKENQNRTNLWQGLW